MSARKTIRHSVDTNLYVLISIIGTLRSNDADGDENVTKTIGFTTKTTILHVHHVRLYISLPVFARLRREKSKYLSNFAFNGVRKQGTTKCYFSFLNWIWSLGIQLLEGSPTFDKVSG